MPTTRPLGPLDHHFLEGQRYHVEQVGEVVTAKNKWRTTTFALIGVVTLQALLAAYLGSLPKQIPYVAERDTTSGALRPLGPAQPWDLAPELTIHSWLREFVQTLRSISTDIEVTRDRWNTTKHRVTTKGRKLLLDYERAWKPLDQREPTKVEIGHIFRRTAKTYDVRWTETRYSSDSKREILSTTRYTGLFTFEQRQPKTTDELKYNFAGIFFDFWQWSEE